MTYECPVCGIADKNAYLRCYRPDCPDGHDQPGLYFDPEVYIAKPVHELANGVHIGALAAACFLIGFGIMWVIIRLIG